MDIAPDLQRAIKTRQLVLFVGAGYSCSGPTNFPSWRKLIERFIEKIKQKDNSKLLDVIMPSLEAGAFDEIHALDLLQKNGYRQICIDELKSIIDIDLSGLDLSKFAKLWG